MTTLGTHLGFFLLISFVTALVSTTIRLRHPQVIARETLRFFLQISIGILIFAAIIGVVEWAFVRPLL